MGEADGAQGRAESGDTPSATVTLRINEDVMVSLLRERQIMGDEAIELTIARRLTSGLAMAKILGRGNLRWCPIHNDAFTMKMSLEVSSLEDLDQSAVEFGYGRDVLAATLLSDEACKPIEVAEGEARYRAAFPMDAPSYVRREPGRGNIYPTLFHIPGYQLVFIRMVGAQMVDKELVIEEALLALARQALLTEHVGGIGLSDEAHAFARKMVRFGRPLSMKGTEPRPAAW